MFFHPDSIRSLNESLVHQKADRSSVLLDRVRAKTKVAFDAILPSNKLHPEQVALRFYYLNHAVSELARQYGVDVALPASQAHVVHQYRKLIYDIAARTYFYTLLAVTRESRHLHAYADKAESEAVCGNQYLKFRASIPNDPSQAVAKFLSSSFGNMTLGRYITAVEYTFRRGSYGASYGGMKWAGIAMALKRLIYGETNIAQFLDTAWTLAHNCGPMFNKGMFYFGYDSAQLMRVLDIQRSGQTPQLVRELHGGLLNGAQGLVQATMTDYAIVKIALPDLSAPGYVDYEKVKADGAIGHYEAEIAAQKSKAHAAMAAQGLKFYIGPDEYAVVYDRAKVAA